MAAKRKNMRMMYISRPCAFHNCRCASSPLQLLQAQFCEFKSRKYTLAGFASAGQKLLRQFLVRNISYEWIPQPPFLGASWSLKARSRHILGPLGPSLNRFRNLGPMWFLRSLARKSLLALLRHQHATKLTTLQSQCVTFMEIRKSDLLSKKTTNFTWNMRVEHMDMEMPTRLSEWLRILPFYPDCTSSIIHIIYIPIYWHIYII